MADLEAVLADVSYLMAMEKSKSTPAARASRKILLPDNRLVDLTTELYENTNWDSLKSEIKFVVLLMLVN